MAPTPRIGNLRIFPSASLRIIRAQPDKPPMNEAILPNVVRLFSWTDLNDRQERIAQNAGVVYRIDHVGFVGLSRIGIVVYRSQLGGSDGGFGGRVGGSEHADVAEAAGFESWEFYLFFGNSNR